MAGLDLDEDIEIRVSEWSNELLGCGDDLATFCYALLCPCFAAGEIYNNADIGHCCIGCSLWCCFRGCLHPCCVTRKIRQKRNISGSFLGDCCAVYCCSPCQLTRELQEVREVRDDRGY